MVFRREHSKVDAFQKQINALRQQIGGGGEGGDELLYDERDQARPQPPAEESRPAATPAASAAPAPAEPRESPAYDPGREPRYAPRTWSEPAPAPAPPAYPAPGVDAQMSVIAHDTTWKGELNTDGSLHVHGRVEGSLKAKQDIFIAEEADVDATMTATNVVIAGLVKGAIRCGGRFEALPQARVTGEIQTPTIVVHEGAQVNGQFRMGAGEGTEVRQTPVVQRRAARGGA